MQDLVELARSASGRVVVLTGAGCSTESGIPDYRGPTAKPRAPMQHREFVDKPDMRRRYWARSLLGWPRLAGAEPNAGHTALAELERRGVLAGIITQNVDSLHQKAGSEHVVELHGALARVRCLACGELTSRDHLQQRLLDANPAWRVAAVPIDPTRQAEPDSFQYRPDGDAELGVIVDESRLEGFTVVACEACGGVLMPDVVFFGGSVPKPTLDAAWALFEQAELLLVAGSSLTVFSGYRFVRRAAERAIPVAIVNLGPTRGDPHAQLRIDERCGIALPQLARAFAVSPHTSAIDG
ncbi:MAG TPA: NAD-dependent protein deacetylase [Kofleriaceae bacterium]|nr:NAD-dependent protein deacetylase [Kofleriaceae bacterium]